MRVLNIGRPYITHVGEAVRLQSNISSAEFNEIYYFEVEEKWGNYLCDERSDAFVIGLMYFSMVNGYDIKCEAPLSEKLYYQLTNTYIPNMARQDSELFNNISIFAELDGNPIKNCGGVGAAVSGGVDSFYTILKNSGQKAKDYNITHLILTDCFNIYRGEKNTRKRFSEICKSGKEISEELGIEFIGIYTNENIFWYPHFVDLYCLRYCSLPYALQKLFSIYNYSTGYQYKDFTFKALNRDASHYDFFTVHLISSENLTIYSSGGEASRADKAEFIADSNVVQNHLQVCNLHQNDNCCICEKCLRTQLNLYACGKIEKFEKSFNLELFERKKDFAIRSIISRGSDFDKEILDMIKKNNIDIPKHIRIEGTLIRVMKTCLKKVKPIYKVLWKIKNKNNQFNESDRYNKDYQYAKKCNPDIV